MAIPRTNLHLFRVVNQIITTLMNLHRGMRTNAQTHRAMAVAQSPALTVLQTFIADAAAAYLLQLQWIIDLRNDSVKEQRLLDVLAKMGWTEPDVVDVVTALRQVAVGLRDAPRSTYAEIITACDAVIAAIQAPDSLWPE